jgi:hypothetical protein
MPMYEYECPIHGRFERIRPLSEADKPFALCFKKEEGTLRPCLVEAPKVEWSVPAWRDPEHGIR